MVNSKGGFLVEDKKEDNEDLRAKERERERQRAMQSVELRTPSTFKSTPLIGVLSCYIAEL